MIEQAPCKLFRLTNATFVERHVGQLQDARRIAGRLTMAHEQNRHAAWLAARVCTREPRIKPDDAQKSGFVALGIGNRLWLKRSSLFSAQMNSFHSACCLRQRVIMYMGSLKV